MPTQRCHDNTIGCDSRFRSSLTLADSNPPGSWVNNTPFRHQVDSQECLQPPDPAPHHSAPQNQISPQLVLSISESLATVAMTVPTRATIAVQLNLANGSHIARNCSKLAEMTRHLLIALQPRRVGALHLVGMESNHLGYDSTAQSRQGAVVATRYPLFVQREVSLPLTIQIKKKGRGDFYY